MRPRLYVVVDAVRVAPGIEIPDGYRPLPEIGSIMPDNDGNTESKIKSIVDGPIEDILTLQYLGTGDTEYDGTMKFPPGLVRVLMLIKIGKEAEDVLKKNIHEVCARAAEVVAEVTEEFDSAETIRVISKARLGQLAKELSK